MEDRTLLSAAIGSLDPTFGSGGLVTANFPGSSNDHAAIAAVQPDGKIVVVGTTRNFRNGNPDLLFSDSVELGLVRYNPNGSLDLTFGNDGVVVTEIPANGGVAAVALQTDGKIVVAESGMLVRFGSDGSLDTAFNSGGVVTGVPATGAAVLANGTIVVSDAGGNLLGFSTDGSPDTAFGLGGTVSTGMSTVSSLLARPDGELLVAGTPVGLSLYRPDGSLDPTFGTGGTTITAQVIPGNAPVIPAGYNWHSPPVPASTQQATSLALQPDGSILVGGNYLSWAAVGGTGTVVFERIEAIGGGGFVARYSPSGVLDTTFGSGGFATVSLPPFDTLSFPTNPAARIVSVSAVSNGEIEVATSGFQSFALARFQSTGTLDGTYGTGGVVTNILPHQGSPNSVRLTGAVALPDGGAIATFDNSGSHDPFFGINTGTNYSKNQITMVRYGPDGSLNASFGTGGEVSTNLGGPSVDSATVVAVQSDGKIVVGGETAKYQVTNLSGSQPNIESLVLVRYNRDGTLDSSFGAGGKVITDLGGDEVLGGMVIQSDGKIVVAGSRAVPVAGDITLTQETDLVVVRYNTDGSLDTPFGDGGVVTLPNAGNSSISNFDAFSVATAYAPTGIVLRPNGTIDVAGFAVDGGIQVTQLKSDGNLDLTFGAGGVAPLDHNGNVAGPVKLVLQPDGKIVAAVNTNYDPITSELDLVRLDLHGLVDSSFGAGGLVATLDGASSYFTLTSLALQPDGEIIAAGSANSNDDPSQSFELIRYTGAGLLDATFGTGGVVTTAITRGFPFATADAFDAINDVAVQSDGRIVAVGAALSDSADFSTWQNDFAVVRYNSDGSLDASFGDGGEVVTSFGGEKSYASTVAIQADGQIVAAGAVFNSATNLDFAVARYQGGLLVDPATIASRLQSIVTTLQQNGSGDSVTLQADSNDEVSAAVSAVNGLTVDRARPITIILNLDGGTYTTDTEAAAPTGATLVITNGTLIGGSPALVVDSGNVVLDGVTTRNATNTPTVVVKGGTLTVRNSTIEESTGYAQVAIQVTGGTVDLGTAADPGHNTINLNGDALALVQDTGPNPVVAVGTSFTVANAPITPSSLSGVVFSDFNDDGQVDFGEQGIGGVPIALDGTDFLGNPVHLSQTTDGNGAYVFANLRPGLYTLTETQQPAGYTPGLAVVGTGGGTVLGAQFQVSLAPSLDALNYNYGERPSATGAIQHGQTAGIGFWNNKNGQALILALNGGVGTQLGDWLAATFPHMFGALAGASNLAGKSNAAVASFFQSRFVVKDVKLDAQVLATALAVYVTDATLDSTGAGTRYGFQVSGNGVATATYNVGTNGAAVGVADNTTMTVMDILLAVDSQAVSGVLYNGNTNRRNQANTIFSGLNQAGSV